MTNDGSLLFEVATKASSRTEIISHYGFLGYLFYTFFIYKPSVLGGIGVLSYLLAPVGIIKAVSKNNQDMIVFLIIYVGLWYFAKASFRHLIWLVPIISIFSTIGFEQVFKYGKRKMLLKYLVGFRCRIKPASFWVEPFIRSSCSM